MTDYSLKADLHMHSTASDGSYPSMEVVEKCAAGGLTMIALTDHDTTSEIENAKRKALSLGMKFIHGIELSTRFNQTSVDILGYGFNPEHPVLQETLSFHREMRKERMNKMLAKCAELNLNVSLEDVKKEVKGETYSRPHLAKALVKKGYGQSISEIFESYLGYGKPCYVTKEKEMTPKEAIKLIHQAGGIAIVAHPIFYDLDSAILEWAIHDHLDGIEVYHRDHDSAAIARFIDLADQAETHLSRPFFRTGGSDFHDESFGRVGEELGVTKLPYKEAEKLYLHLQK